MSTRARKDGQMILFLGVTRSGKSIPVKRLSEKHTRVLAYDPKGEYHLQMGFQSVTSHRELLNALKNAPDRAKISFPGVTVKDFQFFCDCAFNWNRQKEAMIICEELASVTSSGKAAEYWNRLINQSLAFGPLIVGTVQRGQEVDKSMLNSASYVHVAKHSTEDDAVYLAKKLGIPDSEVPRTKLQFIQWTSDRGIVCRGHIDFKGAKSKNWTQGGPRLINARNGKIMSFERDGRLKGVVYR